jgi:hypothetical protein
MASSPSTVALLHRFLANAAAIVNVFAGAEQDARTHTPLVQLALAP